VGLLSGRRVLVTGISRGRGIGVAIARRLAGEGAALFLSGWSPYDAGQASGEDRPAAEGLVASLAASGAVARYAPFDLARPSAPEELVSAAAGALGGLDVLVANHARSVNQSLRSLTAEELDLSFAVNARATLLLLRHFVEARRGEKGGRVVLFSSGQYHGPMPEELPYAASKAAVEQLTRSLAVELAPRLITVNCVNPGPTDTGYATGELRHRVEGAMPMGRWGQPDDAARLVAWLCSDEAGWVTGQTIASDGGWSARGGS
jgi:3-oxoacyl-[acyl-carrier protein] reductase